MIGDTVIAVQNMPMLNKALAAVRWFAKKISSRTFSRYLYHMPIFAILYGGFGFGRGSGTGLFCVAAVVCLCVLFGGVTEARLTRWRSELRIAFRRMRLGTLVG
jgi:peptidoglycan/LPS O-acetylase OafA/YrhL